MIMSIDLIQAPDVKQTMVAWDFVSRFLSVAPGFERGQLVRTFREMNVRDSYELASVCRWSTADEWYDARSLARKNADIVAKLRGCEAKFTSFVMELVDGADYDFSRKRETCLLLDVIYLDRERVKSYAEMWHRCNAFMKTQPGYINASLYQNNSNDDEIKFINIAEWDREDSLLHAAHTEEFGRIVEPFKNDFALYLTNRAALRCTDILEEAAL